MIHIRPDASLPDADWAQDFRKRLGGCRVRATKFRGNVSHGIILPHDFVANLDDLGITHYVTPVGMNIVSSEGNGKLPYGLSKTDEDRWNVATTFFPVQATITKKNDGTSVTIIADPNGDAYITGRNTVLLLDGECPRTRASKIYVDKVKDFAKKLGTVVAIRGEVTGAGIQKFGHNPDAIGEPVFRAFCARYLINGEWKKGQYGTPAYYQHVCDDLGIPTVDVLEHVFIGDDDALTSLAKKYEDIKGIEGVVVKTSRGWSCKILSNDYDSRKK